MGKAQQATSRLFPLRFSARADAAPIDGLPLPYRLSDSCTNCRESKTNSRLELHFRLEFGAVACCKGDGAQARWDPGGPVAFALRSQDSRINNPEGD